MPQVQERGGGRNLDRGGGGGGGNGSGGDQAFPVPTPKIGLWVLLAALTVLFSAIVSAYLVRMDLPDWKHLPKPGLLWVNTAVLVLSSLFLQRSSIAVRRGDEAGMRLNMRIGGALGFAFVIGQLLAWAQLRSLGYYLTGNPSSSFFYLMTALHALHLLGGLVAWAVVGARKHPSPLSVELCTLYWHFLLLVWLVFFGVLLTT